MQKFLVLLNEHQDALASTISAEHGKVFTDAVGEVKGALRLGRSPAAFPGF